MSRPASQEPKESRSLIVLSVVLAVSLFVIAWGVSAPSFAQGGQNQPPQAAPQGRGGAQAGRGAPVERPPLFLRETWKQPPYTGQLNDAARKLTQDAVTNASLELKIYGACKDGGVEVYGAPGNVIFPMNLWTGMCPAPVAITLRDKNNFVDLTGSARIRWTFRAANLHAVHPVLKLADGTLIVGDHADSTPSAIGQGEPEMIESEFSILPIRWYTLDPEKIAVTRPVEKPDFAKVDEVGWADLMPGGGHGSAGWINVGQFEVYGKPVKRDP